MLRRWHRASLSYGGAAFLIALVAISAATAGGQATSVGGQATSVGGQAATTEASATDDGLVFHSRLHNPRRYSPQSEVVIEHRLINAGETALTVPLEGALADHIRYTITDDSGAALTATLGAAGNAGTGTGIGAGVNANATASETAEADAVAAQTGGRDLTLNPQEGILFRDIISERYALGVGTFRLSAQFTAGGETTGSETTAGETAAYRLRSPLVIFGVFEPPADATAIDTTAGATALPSSATTALPSSATTALPSSTATILLPDMAVRNLLRALQTADWEQAYRHLDLVSLYREAPSRNERYVESSAELRQLLLAEFRDLIRTGNTPFLRTPSRYRIIRTEYNDDLAVVHAEIEIATEGGASPFDMQYRLRKGARGEWQVYTVSASVRR